ncbi:MarR family winged helix-turn-helix transcriptional regulator [Hwanghaeella sp.]|uniref:MarR family winged helix-turn-helix transcriptional regulator n=1 Tax=Hwanghaeella sp. TaxID=2605943 RepID=UPI003CCBE348
MDGELPKAGGMDRSDLERNFGFLLHDVARLMRAEFDRRSRTLQLTRSQWWVLNFVYAYEGATQTELADQCEVERATMGRLLDKLEEKGWVRREADGQDRRIRRVYLTGEVLELMIALRGIGAGVRESAMAGIDRDEQDRFVDTLMKIKGNLLALGRETVAEPVAMAGDD